MTAFASAATGTPSDASSIVAQLVAGLTVNFASEELSKLLQSAAASPAPSLSDDLGRVTKHALLTILYETATDHQADAEEAVQQAAARWDARLFPAADPTETQLVELMRQPAPLYDAQAQTIARQLLPPAFAHLQASYSSAIRHRFAPVFEALLRQDDRAYRAVTLYLSRLNQADLAALQDTAGQILQLLRHPQPRLARFENLRTPVSSRFAVTDLQFKRRATLYQLPPSLEASLGDWLNRPDPFRVLKLTGAAGMGKSRLALALCDYCHAQNWLAGFVPDTGWPETWTPLRDTIAVLDYAASKSINGRSSFQWLESLYQQVGIVQPPSGRPARVRIVLIDRSEYGPLWTDWRTSEIAMDLDKVTLAVDLKPTRAEFDAIVQAEFQRRLSRPPSSEESQRLDTVASRLHDDFRPLFALLTADAAISAGNAGNPVWSPELLLENILKAQIHQWKVADLQDTDLDLLFEATATQGACNQDQAFTARRKALPPAKLAALQSLSDPTEGLGPIVPDLLGEFFVLMRLRGETSVGTQQTQVIAEQSWQIWNCASHFEPKALFAGRLLEDYLPWTPRCGVNPAVQIMEQRLLRIQNDSTGIGLVASLFAAVRNRPFHCTYSSLLKESPIDSAYGLSIPLAGMFLTATVREHDPSKCLALAEQIQALHDDHRELPFVRDALAKALHNAAVAEPDPVQRLAIADRIEALHRDHGQEPAVREALAMALQKVTVVESNPANCLAIVDRIEALHRDHGQEPAVRDALVRALYKVTLNEPNPANRLKIASRIEALHRDHGQEPVVRHALAEALGSATAIEPDPAERLAIADRIEALHRDHGQEPAVREALAKSLYNSTVIEPDPAERLAIADRIEALHRDHGQEPAVRDTLAKALRNAIFVESNPANCLAIVDRIEALHRDHGQEPAVREALAGALAGATVVEPDPAKRLVLADRIEALHRNHGQEPAVREALVQASFNHMFAEPNQVMRNIYLERLLGIRRSFPDDPIWLEFDRRTIALLPSAGNA